MKTTTLAIIKSHLPCAEGWRKLTKALGTTEETTVISYAQILESNGIDDAIWALRCDKMLAVEYALTCAESVLPIFEAEHPTDNRARAALESARLYLGDPTEENRVKCSAAAAAAYAAANATYAAYAAAYASAYAAFAASDGERARTLAHCAQIVRTHYPVCPAT